MYKITMVKVAQLSFYQSFCVKTKSAGKIKKNLLIQFSFHSWTESFPHQCMEGGGGGHGSVNLPL